MQTNPRFTDRAGYQLVAAGLLFILVLSSPGIAQTIGRAEHFVQGSTATNRTPSSPIDAYYYFVHWVSMGRPDLALEQFDPQAWVVAGPGCPARAPCVGAAAIRDRYLPALLAGELPLPLADLRFDGGTLRTYGDTLRPPHPVGGAAARTGNHEIDLRGGRIISLRFDEAGAHAALGREADPTGLGGHGFRMPYVQDKPDASNGTIVLVHRIKMAKDASWQANAIALIAGGWHVSDANGVVATDAQLLSVFQNVASIEIGGVCRGWLDGPTSYPCGFAVREVDLAGQVDERFAAMEFDNGSGVISAWTSQPPPARSGITATPSAPRFIAVRLPRVFLGNVSPALGGHLRFDLRTISNPLLPSQFDSTSGLVVLRGRKENAI